MQCAEAVRLLSKRRDDELASDQQASLEQHLSGCAECRLVAAAWEFHAVWQKGFEPVVPVGFAARVVRRVQQKLPSSVWPLLENLAARFFPAVAAAVAVLGIALVATIQRDLRRDADWYSYEALTAESQRAELVAYLQQEGTFEGLAPIPESNLSQPEENREK